VQRIIKAFIRKGETHYVAECLEISVATQGKTLDETIANLQEAVALHLGGGPRRIRPCPQPRPAGNDKEGSLNECDRSTGDKSAGFLKISCAAGRQQSQDCV